ncbi:MAG: hypothetical protein AB2604_10765 [Candidatus Thiodiazotropha taylori]
MSKRKVCLEAAKAWLRTNPDSTPKFSGHLGMPGVYFNENDAADEIEDAITLAGQEAGYFIEPSDVVLAAVEASKELRVS